jgi:RNA polymerase sigma-70 factor (ECF subfamily)
VVAESYSLGLLCVPLPGTVFSIAVSSDYDLWQDEELARHYLKTGADHLFSILVRRYKEKVFRLVVSVLGPTFSEEAEEVVQEVFLTVHRNLKRFRFDSQFSTWLYRIAFNRSVDWRRKPRLRFHHSDEGSLLRQASSGKSPLRKVTDQERGERVLESVERLPQPWRSVILLHYWLDQSVSEIAEYLDLNPSTVKSHLFRARKLLGSSLRGKV